MTEVLLAEPAFSSVHGEEQALVQEVVLHFYEHLEEIRKQELRRHQKQFKAAEIAMLEQLTLSFIRKVMQLPLKPLEKACERGEGALYSETLRALFDLHIPITRT